MSDQLTFAIPDQPPRKMPAEPIVRSAEIEGEYRWTLKRAWGAGKTILWCGLNPSTADGTRDDPTMLREIGFSYRWGFGALIKVNLYPFRSSKPAELEVWRKTFDHKTYEAHGMRPWGVDNSSWSAFHHNIGVIQDFVVADPALVCVAAWGNGADEMDLQQLFDGVQYRFDDEEFGMISSPLEWKCLGTNADGSPKHTLARGGHRIPDDATLIPWSPRR